MEVVLRGVAHFPRQAKIYPQIKTEQLSMVPWTKLLNPWVIILFNFYLNLI